MMQINISCIISTASSCRTLIIYLDKDSTTGNWKINIELDPILDWDFLKHCNIYISILTHSVSYLYNLLCYCNFTFIYCCIISQFFITVDNCFCIIYLFCFIVILLIFATLVFILQLFLNGIFLRLCVFTDLTKINALTD